MNKLLLFLPMTRWHGCNITEYYYWEIFNRYPSPRKLFIHASVQGELGEIQKDTRASRRLTLRIYRLQAEGEGAFLARSRLLPLLLVLFYFVWFEPKPAESPPSSRHGQISGDSLSVHSKKKKSAWTSTPAWSHDRSLMPCDPSECPHSIHGERKGRQH